MSFFRLPVVMAVVRKTTIEECLGILRLLKYFGVFPYKFDYKILSVGPERLKRFEKLGIDTSWKYSIYQGFILIYYLTHYAFGSIHIVKGFSNEMNPAFYLNVLCIMILSGATVVLTLLLNYQMKGVVKFLNDWHLLEGRLLPSFKKDHKNWKFRPYMFLVRNMVSSALVNFFTFVIPSITSPRYGLFLYSILDPNVELAWFHVVSTLDMTVSLFFRFFHITQFTLLAIAFPKSIQDSLHSILPPSLRHPNSKSTKFDHFEHRREKFVWKNFKYYAHLDDLLLKFNFLFATPMICLKFVYMVCFCVIFYFPLRHPQLLNAVSFGIFTNIAIIMLRLTTQVHIGMGAVQREALHFKKAWTEELIHGNPNTMKERRLQIHILNSAPTMSFSEGSFYTIRSFTILTFASVTTSYVILALQLF